MHSLADMEKEHRVKALLAIVAGFGASLGMFAGGLALAIYLVAVEPEQQPGPSVDVADLWTAEPRKVDRAGQHLERLPAETPSDPKLTAGNAADPARNPATGAVDDFVTGSVQAAAGEAAREDRVPPDEYPSNELSAAHLAWCADRYRSYRPEDDSYTSYSGDQQPCVSPFSGDLAATAEDVSSPLAESYPELLAEPAVQYASDGPAAFASDDHVSYCFSRYRSYRPEDNSYQPYGGGPRQQCR